MQNLFSYYLFLFIFIITSKLAASRGGSVMILIFNELGLKPLVMLLTDGHNQLFI